MGSTIRNTSGTVPGDDSDYKTAVSFMEPPSSKEGDLGADVDFLHVREVKDAPKGASFRTSATPSSEFPDPSVPLGG